jgi:hypothetical protein
MSYITELPQPLLVHMLQQLTPKQHSGYALVDSSWRAAATLATTSISVPEQHCGLSLLSLWVQHHAAALDGSHAVGTWATMMSLPEERR